MDDNLENTTNINIDDFIKIYPPIIPSINNSQSSNKYIRLFSFKNSIRKASTAIQKKLSRQLNNNNSLLLSFINNFNINSIDSNDNFDNKNDTLINLKEKEKFSLEKTEYYLLLKAIDLQNNNKKRSSDIKNALSQFFLQSDLISKLSNFFKKYGLNTSNEISNLKNNENGFNLIKKTSQEKLIEKKIQTIIQKLVDNVKIEKYNVNDYVIRMNEIGKQCYFLIGGRLSILKPVFYKDIKISYENYFKYLISLINNKEIELAKQIIEINKFFINAYSIQNLLDIIKVYCLVKIRNNIKKLDEYKMVNINKIEKVLSHFNLTLKDYNLNKNEIIYNMNKIMEDSNVNTNIKSNKRINDYFLKITNPSKEDLFIIKTYNFLFKNQNQNDNNNNNDQPYRTNVVTLGKYEIFLILEPGAFFGEMALENESYRRNATIRVEENCFTASLNNDLYNAIFLEENKKLKIKDVNFICNNFFLRKYHLLFLINIIILC